MFQDESIGLTKLSLVGVLFYEGHHTASLGLFQSQDWKYFGTQFSPLQLPPSFPVALKNQQEESFGLGALFVHQYGELNKQINKHRLMEMFSFLGFLRSLVPALILFPFSDDICYGLNV